MVMVAGEAQDEILGNMVFDIWGRLLVGAVISPKVGLPSPVGMARYMDRLENTSKREAINEHGVL